MVSGNPYISVNSAMINAENPPEGSPIALGLWLPQAEGNEDKDSRIYDDERPELVSRFLRMHCLVPRKLRPNASRALALSGRRLRTPRMISPEIDSWHDQPHRTREL